MDHAPRAAIPYQGAGIPSHTDTLPSACQRPVLPYEQPEYCRQRNSRMHCLAPQEPAVPSYISHNPVRRRPDVCPHSSEVPYQSHWTCRADVSTESSPDLDPDLKEVYL